MIRLGRPGILGVVDIAEMEVGIPLDEAAKRYVRGMPMRGMTVESTSNVSQRGHEARRIRGILTVRVAGRQNSFPVEVFLIMTQECILSVEAVGEDATSTMNEVLSWIAFQSATAPSKASDTKGGEGRSNWEYIGMSIVLVAVAYAILKSTSLRRKKRGWFQF
jgi:hypothetical protein